MSDGLDTEGVLSYVISGRNGICEIRINDIPLDELLDDSFEPKHIMMDVNKDTIIFGNVKIRIERID